MKKKSISFFMACIILTCILATGSGIAAQPVDKIPVIITFKDKPNPSLVHGYGGDIKHTYSIVPAISAKLSKQAVEAIGKNEKVAYVEPDYEVYVLGETLPWGVDRIDAEKVHPYNKGTGVNVAIIDTGIDYTHPDLDANYRGGYDFVNDGPDPMDDHGHGTHCAGIVAAEDNEIGVIGAAPEAYLYGVKVLDSSGSGYVSDVVAGIDWAISNGMQVISMSIGSNYDSVTLHNACDAAYDAGIIVVAAAGNDGRGSGWGDNVDYPARYDSVIAVAATDSYDNRARWSSTGPDVELSAPGVYILSTYPGGYAYMSGTSMACPHVTGTAALAIVSYPAKTTAEIRQILQDTADDLGATGRDTWYGYGLVDAEEAAPPGAEDTTPPASVTNLNESAVGETWINWTWTNPADGDFSHVMVYLDGIFQTNVSKPTNSYNATGLTGGTEYELSTHTVDIAGNVNLTWVNDTATTLMPDSTPPASVTGLNESAVGEAWINWTWTNPADGDFSHVMIYLDGAFQTNVSKPMNYFNATVLTGGTLYELSTHTVDITGNVNLTWVNDTATTLMPDSTPPASVTALSESAVGEDWINWTWTNPADDDFRHVMIYLDGIFQTNVSKPTNSYNATGLTGGTLYELSTHTVDTTGNVNLTWVNDTATTLAPPIKAMHVQSIDMTTQERGSRTRAVATVAIVDADNNPVDGATVSGHWSGLTTDTDARNTDSDGQVRLYSNWVRRASGTFTFTVDDVAKAGWTYDASANNKTSESITV